jgi:PAS domain S-box-containing protein
MDDPNAMTLGARAILDSMTDGVYATDLDRRIIYWNQAAERIVGWTTDDVIGRQCRDNLLCHTDRHGAPLCLETRCPLFTSMRNATASDVPEVIFARHKNGGKIPLQVTVAPLRDGDGRVIGGVESFRNATLVIKDLYRAAGIQRDIMRGFPRDEQRLAVDVEYAPLDMIGGDFLFLRTARAGLVWLFSGRSGRPRHVRRTVYHAFAIDVGSEPCC